MKYWLAFALSLGLVLAACTPNAPSPNDTNNTPMANSTSLGDTTNSSDQSIDNAAVILYNGALNEENDKGQMAYKASATAMSTVYWYNEIKEAVRAYDGLKRPFAKIRDLDSNKDYWIQDVFVASNAVPGVIIDTEAVMYSKANAASPTSTIIPQYTMVAVHPELSKDDFIVISAYIDTLKNPVLTRVFLRKNTVSTSSTDVEAMNLFQMATKETKDIKKRALLKAAVEINSSFRDMIQTSYDEFEMQSEAVKATGRAVEELVANFLVITTEAKVYDIPSEIGSTVIATIPADQALESNARTKEEYSLGNDTARWYRISKPAGWVFGADLSEVKK